MVETLALRIAEAIKRFEPDKTASVPVMKFSLEVLINTFISIFAIGVIGLLTGELGQTFIGLGAFVTLRFFSGGMHMRKALHCSLISIIMISIAPHVNLSELWIQIITGTSLVIILLFAPSNIEGHARLPTKFFPFLKFISALIVCTNFIFVSSAIAAVFLTQSISTIHNKRR